MFKKAMQIMMLVGWTSISSFSIAAPGEDTIQLSNPVEHLQLPIGGRAPSSGLDAPSEIPPHLKAKIVRYEAKVFSEQKEGIYTDGDVNRTISAQANRKTCIQDVASNTGAQAGAGAKEQIVVLRGDLINVCR